MFSFRDASENPNYDVIAPANREIIIVNFAQKDLEVTAFGFLLSSTVLLVSFLRNFPSWYVSIVVEYGCDRQMCHPNMFIYNSGIFLLSLLRVMKEEKYFTSPFSRLSEYVSVNRCFLAIMKCL